jgi:peptidoglycan/LPS O-acetylase OafA/YrhL
MASDPVGPGDLPSRRLDNGARYMPQLDGLRAVAVMLVFWHHWIASEALRPGIVGVELFFVLSGFLITGIVLQCKAQVQGGARPGGLLGSFYARRALRIFPAFYATLVVLYGLDLALVRELMPWHASYLSNVYFSLRGSWQGTTSHFWSLAVEEQFYLFWPAVVLGTPRRFLGPMIIGVIVVAPVFRMLLHGLGVEGFVRINTWLFANLDALGLGAWLAHVQRLGAGNLKRTISSKTAMIALLVCAAAVSGAGGAAGEWIGVVLAPTALCLVLAGVVARAAGGFGGTLGGVLESSPMRYLGGISYGLYIYHNFAPAVFRNTVALVGAPGSAPDGVARLLLLFGITVVLASGSWFLVERPFLRLKQHFPYRAGPRPVRA